MRASHATTRRESRIRRYWSSPSGIRRLPARVRKRSSTSSRVARTSGSSRSARERISLCGEESDAAFPGGAILPRLGPPELTRPAALNSAVAQFSSTQSVSGSVTYCERCDFRCGSWLRELSAICLIYPQERPKNGPKTAVGIPDDKVIADFRKDNGPAIRRVRASLKFTSPLRHPPWRLDHPERRCRPTHRWPRQFCYP